ncbi:hypothetical protein [Saprospira grandis]|uniref:hypothetical protein n=1 Tax=Saprospira grandis TaxID=1008 RepID=UPI0022DE18F0|nr:hypothetical protein [Saprospira grandis]WBM74142.1 hypothetical protein OP864_14230 [Saprospira grandis]
MKNKKLEIICIYKSKFGDEFDFPHPIGCIEDDEIANFEGITGGFFVTLNGYEVIFRKADFDTLLQAISFLLDSLYWLKESPPAERKTVEDDLLTLVLETMSGEKLVLTKVEDGKLTLSFLAANKEQEDRRGYYYCSDILIDTKDWKEATNKALEEYFTLAQKVISINEGQSSRTLNECIDLWEKVRFKREKVRLKRSSLLNSICQLFHKWKLN